MGRIEEDVNGSKWTDRRLHGFKPSRLQRRSRSSRFKFRNLRLSDGRVASGAGRALGEGAAKMGKVAILRHTMRQNTRFARPCYARQFWDKTNQVTHWFAFSDLSQRWHCVIMEYKIEICWNSTKFRNNTRNFLKNERLSCNMWTKFFKAETDQMLPTFTDEQNSPFQPRFEFKWTSGGRESQIHWSHQRFCYI